VNHLVESRLFAVPSTHRWTHDSPVSFLYTYAYSWGDQEAQGS
jgi:hypothetical protein